MHPNLHFVVQNLVPQFHGDRPYFFFFQVIIIHNWHKTELRKGYDTCTKVVFPDPAIPRTIKHIGFFCSFDPAWHCSPVFSFISPQALAHAIVLVNSRALKISHSFVSEMLDSIVLTFLIKIFFFLTLNDFFFSSIITFYQLHIWVLFHF